MFDEAGCGSRKEGICKNSFVAGNALDRLARGAAVYNAGAGLTTYTHFPGPAAVTYDCEFWSAADFVAAAVLALGVVFERLSDERWSENILAAAALYERDAVLGRALDVAAFRVASTAASGLSDFACR